MVLAQGSHGLVREAKKDRHPPAFRVRTAQDSSSGTRDGFWRWQHLLKVERKLELVRQRKLGLGGAGKSGNLGESSQQCRERMKRDKDDFKAEVPTGRW